ncbi:MAG: hypothetical protein PUC47_02570 [Oscillospiraceae bacterium]|nr:hypothetical protein [Oscillospiraceae bacterium]
MACTNGRRDHDTDVNAAMTIDFGENGMIRSGTEHATFQVEEGQKGILSFDISRVSGRLDIDVCRLGKEDDPDYTGRELDSASFDVIVEHPGEYKVCFTAAEFVGDYEISWKAEENVDN